MDKREQFLALVRSSLEIMAQSEMAAADTGERKAFVLQRHLLVLAQVIEVADKLRDSDTALDAALDVISNLFDARYGSGRDRGWFVQFRPGPPTTKRAAWAGLKARSQVKASFNVETKVKREWKRVSQREHKTPTVIPRMEAYLEARKAASAERRSMVHERPDVRRVLIFVRKNGQVPMRDLLPILRCRSRTPAVRIMNSLQEDGWVELIGKGAGQRWGATSKLRQHVFERPAKRRNPTIVPR